MASGAGVGEKTTPDSPFSVFNMETRLYVSGFKQHINENDLGKCFAYYGDVKSVDFHEKKDSEGYTIFRFAFINIKASPENVVECIRCLNQSKWKQSVLKVERAKESFLSRLKKERESQNNFKGRPTSSSKVVNSAIVGKSSFLSPISSTKSCKPPVFEEDDDTSKPSNISSLGISEFKGTKRLREIDNNCTSSNSFKEADNFLERLEKYSVWSERQCSISENDDLVHSKKESKCKYKEYGNDNNSAENIATDSNAVCDESQICLSDKKKRSTSNLRPSEKVNKENRNANKKKHHSSTEHICSTETEPAIKLDKNLKQRPQNMVPRLMVRYDPSNPEHRQFELSPPKKEIASAAQNCDTNKKLLSNEISPVKKTKFSFLETFDSMNNEEKKVSDESFPFLKSNFKSSFFISQPQQDPIVKRGLLWITRTLTPKEEEKFAESHSSLLNISMRKHKQYVRHQNKSVQEDIKLKSKKNKTKLKLVKRNSGRVKRGMKLMKKKDKKNIKKIKLL